MSEKTTLVVTAIPSPDEMESVQAYLQGVMPLLMGAGGNLVKRLKVGEVVNGKPSAMVLVMDFDSIDAISGMFKSEDYAALIPVRDKGFAEMNVLLAQDM
jgi:uncharacterized protein (DUF1330 family)